MNQPSELNTIPEYRGAIEYNRTAFLLNHAWTLNAFSEMDIGFSRLVNLLKKFRGPEGKSRVSFIPFLLLMQRQARNSFERLSSLQSYDAWVLLRPCLESVLFLGKWTDDIGFAKIWENRATDRDAFRREYSGKKLRSKSLGRSDELQQVLSRINDDFMHVNSAYYFRHMTEKSPDQGNVCISFNYFDTPVDNEAHTLAQLHLLVLVQEQVLALFTSIFGEIPIRTMGLSNFEKLSEQRVRNLLGNSPQHEVILEELGLWPKLRST